MSAFIKSGTGPQALAAALAVFSVALLPALGCSTRSRAPQVASGQPRRGQVFIVTAGRENVRLGLVTVGLFPEDAMEAHVAALRALASTRRDSLGSMLEAARRATAAAKRRILTPDEVLMQIVDRRNRLQGELNATPDESSPEWRKINEEYKRNEDRFYKANDMAEATRQPYLASVANERSLQDQIDFLDSGSYYLSGLPSPVATAESDVNGDFIIHVPGDGRFVLAAMTERLVGAETETYAWLCRVPPDDPPGTPILLSNNTLTTFDSPLSLVRTSR